MYNCVNLPDGAKFAELSSEGDRPKAGGAPLRVERSSPKADPSRLDPMDRNRAKVEHFGDSSHLGAPSHLGPRTIACVQQAMHSFAVPNA